MVFVCHMMVDPQHYMPLRNVMKAAGLSPFLVRCAYVFHAFAIWLCIQRIHVSGEFREWLLKTTAAFLLTVVLALMSYRWLETPFLRLKDRFSYLQSAPIEPTS